MKFVDSCIITCWPVPIADPLFPSRQAVLHSTYLRPAITLRAGADSNAVAVSAAIVVALKRGPRVAP